MRTAIYARESDDESDENVDIQRAECERYADEMGWRIVGIFEDRDISAFSGKRRPGYEALKASIQAGEVECVLVTEMTRLNRRIWKSIDLFQLAAVTPLKRITRTNGQGFDLSTPQGVHNAIEAAMEAEKESLRLGERVQRKKATQAQAGMVNGGRRPYGYDYIPAVRNGRGKVVEPGRLVRNEHEARVINDVAGKAIDGRSLRSLCIELNGAGERTAEGRLWRPQNLRRVLTSHRIKGVRIHNDEEHPAGWSAILDADRWERLQLVLNAEARFKGAATKGHRSYLLTGAIYCGACGEEGEPGALLIGYGNRDGRGGEMRRRYYCRTTDNQGVRRGCGQVSRLAEPVELLVSEAVLDVLDSPRMAELLSQASQEQEIAELLEEYQAKKLKLDDLVADYASGLLDRHQLAQAKAIVEAAMASLRGRMNKLQSGRALAAIPVGRSLREAWQTADVDWRRQLVALVVDKVILHPGRPGGRSWPDPERDEWEAELAERIDRQWRFDPAAVEIRWKV